MSWSDYRLWKCIVLDRPYYSVYIFSVTIEGCGTVAEADVLACG